MMVNLKEECYEPYTQSVIEAYKKNPTDPNLARQYANIQPNPPIKDTQI